MRRTYTRRWSTYSSRSSRMCRIAIAQKRGERTGKPDARSPSVVTPVCSTWLGDEHVVRAHIPHASTTVSEQHVAIGANVRQLALPTLNRVSRGLSRRAPPIIRGARHAKRLFLQAGQVYCDIPSYLDFRPWGIFSTGTHAAACNFVTPPIEALVSTSCRPTCTRTIMYRVYREIIRGRDSV